MRSMHMHTQASLTALHTDIVLVCAFGGWGTQVAVATAEKVGMFCLKTVDIIEMD